MAAYPLDPVFKSLIIRGICWIALFDLKLHSIDFEGIDSKDSKYVNKSGCFEEHSFSGLSSKRC